MFTKSKFSGPLHGALYKNLHFLMFHVPPSVKMKEFVKEDMFVHANMPCHLEVIHYLFNIWDKALCEDLFKFCWPVMDKTQEAQFRQNCCKIFQDIRANHPEAQLPLVTVTILMSPGGDRYCTLMLQLTNFIMATFLRRNYGDTPILHKTVPSKKYAETSKTLLQAQTLRAIRAGVQEHAVVVDAVKKAKQFIEDYDKTVNTLEAVKKEECRNLKELLLRCRLEDHVFRGIINTEDFDELTKWRNRVKNKRENVHKLVLKLEEISSKTLQCRQRAETAMNSKDRCQLSGDNIKELFSSNLCNQLGKSEEEVKNRLFCGDKVSLEGLLDIGSQALKAEANTWQAEDIVQLTRILPKLRELVEMSSGQSKCWSEIDKELSTLNSDLRALESSCYKKAYAAAMPPGHSTQAFNESTSAPSQAALLPCTPELNMMDSIKQGIDNPFLLNLSSSKDLQTRTSELIQLWNGAHLSSDDSSDDDVNEPTKVEKYIKTESTSTPLSPKRVHPYNESLRETLSQHLQPDAPPPTKDLRTHIPRLLRPKPGVRSMSHFKQSLTARPVQDYLTPVRSRAISSPNQLAGPSSFQFIGLEQNLWLPQEDQIHCGSKNKDSSEHSVDSGFPCSEWNSVQNHNDSASSLLGEIPLGDLSLQEIAEMHLSLHSSPSASPMQQFLKSPNTPSSVSLASSMLSPPAEAEIEKSKIASAKPSSMEAIMHRLQAIKMNLEKPVVEKIKSPLTPAPTSQLYIPKNIKLEFESPL